MQSSIARGGLVAAIAILVSLGFSFGLNTAAPAQELNAAAELTARGAWSPAVLYRTDDVVTTRGSTWRAKKANKGKVPGQTQPSTAVYWELLASGFHPLGAWLSTTKYQPNDLVTNNGSTWRAKRTNINKAPVAGANWEQFAAVGTQGIQGIQGTPGDQGIQGIQGPPGPNTGLPLGDNTAPSISFTGDPGTGIFSPAFGKIALTEQGSTVLHFKSGNTAVGSFALGSNGPSGFHNTAVGETALLTNSTGFANTAVGWAAMNANGGGSSNTAVGNQALWVNGGSSNVGVGDQTLKANVFGTFNTAVGANALQANTGSNWNTSVGSGALKAADAAFNTAVGADALTATTIGEQNTAVGWAALEANVGGSNNIAIGQSAGGNPTESNNSIFIGNPGIVSDDGTIKIGVQGTQLTTFIAGIANVTAGDQQVMIDSTTGQLGVASPSSRRYKTDVESMADMSSVLTKLRPVTFRYKRPRGDGSHPLQYGLIAEETAELMPNLALFDKEGRPDGVKYHLLPALLLSGWQAQQKTIAAQAQTIEAQGAEIAELKRRLAAIEARLSTKTAAR